MRVCMFVKNSFEYDARVTKEAQTLVGAGHEVTVVAVHVAGVTPRRERREDGIEVVRVPRLHERLARLRGPSTTVAGAASVDFGGSTGAAVRRVARAGEPLLAPPVRAIAAVALNRRFVAAGLATGADVFHAHDLNTLWVATTCAARTDAAVVYDSHELQTQRDGMRPARRLWASWTERRGVVKADRVITATETWADYLTGLYRVERPVVVRNVPHRVELRPGSDLRRWAGVAEESTLLLYQGSIQRHRGIEEAITALRWLPGAELVVLGYGAHRPALEGLAANLGLAARVHFPGPVPNEELVQWTSGADIGLCCIANSSLSYYTSLPNKLFEYAMAGVPVVASDFPEMGRFVRDEGVGEVCDPGDPCSIAAAVERLRNDAERRSAARRRALDAARRHHWGAEEGRLLAVYDRLARGVEAARSLL